MFELDDGYPQGLPETARALVGGGRGILAADESPGTMSTRLRRVGVAPTGEARRDYRELIVTTPGLARWVSGVILCEETFHQRLTDGRSFPVALHRAGILPGIKVDKGVHPLAGAPGETVTEGLDGLRERLDDYRALGARFAKWRAVLRIGPGTPGVRAVRANAHALARYAAHCQEAGLVPIVEPEVLMDGDHGLSRCEQVTSAVLIQLFDELRTYGVQLESVVLKPNMVTPGAQCPVQEEVDTVARVTVDTMRLAVPPNVAGIAFLSGGQPPQVATARLAAMQRFTPRPWELTFSFGRALLDPVLAGWAGDPRRAGPAQQALAGTARANSLARAAGTGRACAGSRPGFAEREEDLDAGAASRPARDPELATD